MIVVGSIEQGIVLGLLFATSGPKGFDPEAMQAGMPLAIQAVSLVLNLFSNLIILTLVGMLTCGIYSGIDRLAREGSVDIGAVFSGFSKFFPCLIFAVFMAIVQFVFGIVILGAGTAGTIMANRLAASVAGADITVVDQDDRHVYQPGLLFVPFGTYRPEQIVKSRRAYLPGNARYVNGAIERVAPRVAIGEPAHQGSVRLSREQRRGKPPRHRLERARHAGPAPRPPVEPHAVHQREPRHARRCMHREPLRYGAPQIVSHDAGGGDVERVEHGERPAGVPGDREIGRCRTVRA